MPRPDQGQTRSFLRGKIEPDIGPIAVEEFAVVAHGFSRLDRLEEVALDRGAGARDRDHGRRFLRDRGARRHGRRLRQVVFHRPFYTVARETLGFDEFFQPELQCALRQLPRQGLRNILALGATGILPYRGDNRRNISLPYTIPGTVLRH